MCILRLAPISHPALNVLNQYVYALITCTAYTVENVMETAEMPEMPEMPSIFTSLALPMFCSGLYTSVRTLLVFERVAHQNG
jgi:hypothetical protein